MKIEDLKENLQNEEFRQMLEEQGYNVQEMIEAIMMQEQEGGEAKGGVVDLENMDPDELKQYLMDPDFREMLQ